MKLKMLAPWKERYDKPRQCIKKQRYHFANKRLNNQNFASSPVWMWELTTKQAVKWKLKVFVSSRQFFTVWANRGAPKGWAPIKWRFQIVVRLLSIPYIARRADQSILKETNPEYSLEGLMLKMKLQYFGHLMWRADSLEKTLMLGKTEEEKGVTEDETVGWHHRLNGHEFEQAPEDGEGPGSLASCCPWGCKESDMT